MHYKIIWQSLLATVLLGLLYVWVPDLVSGMLGEAAAKNKAKVVAEVVLNEQSSDDGEVPPVLLKAKIFHCRDGDTCRVKVMDALWFNARLAGVDAPEVASRRGKGKGQPLGEAARDFLNQAVEGQDVSIRQVDLDPYNRPVIEIFRDQRNINLQLMEQGLAELYDGKTKRIDRNLYEQAEQRAKTAKVGIWGQGSYQSPKEYRRSL